MSKSGSRHGFIHPIAWLAGLSLCGVFGSTLAGCEGRPAPAEDEELSFTGAPVVQLNPNPHAPLAAVISFAASEPVETTLRVSDGERTWRLTYDASRSPEAGLPVVGMRPDREHEIHVSIRNQDGKTVESVQALKIKSLSLPSNPMDFPPSIQVTTNMNGKREPGITWTNLYRTPSSPNAPPNARNYGVLLAVDPHGDVVWYYIDPGAEINDFQFLGNGNILLNVGLQLREIDMLGNTVQEWMPSAAAGPGDIPVQTLALHHAGRELPSGNMLSLGATRRSIVDFPTSATNPSAPPQTQMVMGDEILEIQPDGTVAWRWDTFDHLDPYRIGYTAFNQFWPQRGFPDTRDWTHGNTVVVDPSDGSVIFGMRAQSAIVKVDRHTGELRWILGDPTSWNAPQANLLLTPVGDVHWSYCHHGPSLTPQGTLLVYNNDFHRAIPYQPRPAPSTAHSRVIEYAVDEQTMTVQEVWSSALPGETAIVGWAIGDAKWMPKKGNVLVSHGAVVPVGSEQTVQAWGELGLLAGTWSRIAEFTHETPPKVVWELIIKDTSTLYPTGWESYHVERRPKLSKAEEGDDDALAPSAL